MTEQTAGNASGYAVEFERIGRTRGLPVQHFAAVNGDDLAEQVWRFARRHLGSRWFDVTVDLEAMNGFIEFGRFGRFTIAEEHSGSQETDRG